MSVSAVLASLRGSRLADAIDLSIKRLRSTAEDQHREAG